MQDATVSTKCKCAIGNVLVGGNHPISMQSMTNTDTRDVKTAVKQIWDLEKKVVKLFSVPDMKAAKSLGLLNRKFIFLW